jgi:ELWxxDGT repeat protein
MTTATISALLTPDAGRELWATNAVLGDYLVADINPGESSSNPFGFTAVGFGNLVVFAAETNTHGRELWVTDGSAGGTRMLTDIRGGPSSSFPTGFLALGDGRVLFTAIDGGAEGAMVWVTDGTTAGTRRFSPTQPDSGTFTLAPLSVITNLGIPTNQSSVTLIGRTEPGATVELFDGTTSLGTVAVDGTGAWTRTVSFAEERAYSYVAKATDADGTGSSLTRTFTYDVTPPDGDMTTPAGTFGITTPTLRGAGEAGSTIALSLNGNELGRVTADSTGAWALAVTLPGTGDYTVTGTIIDPAGNSASIGSVPVSVDVTPPAFAVTIPASMPVTNGPFRVVGTGEPGAIVRPVQGGPIDPAS